MNIKVLGSLVISNYTDEQFKKITNGLSLLNPAYAVMRRQGNTRALYAIPEYFKYYKLTKDGLVVGRGVLERLRRSFPNYIDKVDVDVVYPQIQAKEIVPRVVLRDYQEGVTEKILPNFEGVIRLDTAFGKSIIAMKLIEETKLRTLIVVPRLNLLRQFKDDIKKMYGYESGIINGPTFTVKEITIATIQTLKKRDLSKISREFGMCIWDECHTYISDKGIKVIQSFNPLRLYGMTATDDRSDGQGQAINFYFGDVVIDRKLPYKNPVVQIVKCVETIITIRKKVGDKNIECVDYPAIIDAQTNNIGRNKLIAQIAKTELEDNRKIIILTKRVNHSEELHKLLPACKAYNIKSSLKNEEQKRQNELLSKLREGGKDFDIIIGTFGLLSTGINIPALDTIIFAGDLKSSVLATQSIGRIMRLFEGKQHPKIIDIDDVKSGILHSQALKRKQFYKLKGWEII